jgi:L-threonylcarbamoyladenylate synthase
MSSAFQLRLAAHQLHKGGVVAYPTEAIYGLGCDPLNRRAVARLLDIKQRPLSKGLILIAASFDQLIPFISHLPEEQMQAVLESWPGPNTWLLPTAKSTPRWLTGGRDSIAVRVTAHPLAAGLCRAFGGAIVSTSANLSGYSPAKTALEVRLRCPGSDAILHGNIGDNAQPTTIRNALSGEVIRP